MNTKGKDQRLHFWVGLMMAGAGGYALYALQGQKLSDELNLGIFGILIAGVVLMIRYPIGSADKPKP